MTAPTTLTTITGCTTVRLAVQGDTLYFTDGAHGSVRKIPTAGGNASDIVTGQMQPYSLVVDATNVYFGDDGDFTLNARAHRWQRCQDDGHDRHQRRDERLGAGRGERAFLRGRAQPEQCHGCQRIRCPPCSGRGDTGGKGLPSEIALDATNVYYTDANALGRPTAPTSWHGGAPSRWSDRKGTR